MKKDILSWNDVKEKYLEFHKMDSFTENMAIDVDFGYWLVNNCVIPDVSGSFVCYLCGYTYNRVGEPCMHYDKDEMDDEGEVSLCDECIKKVMKTENTQGLSRRFFNCH